MERYIDLDKAIERLKASPAFPNFGTDGYFLLGVVVELLEQQPNADVISLEEHEAIVKTMWNDGCHNGRKMAEQALVSKRKQALNALVDLFTLLYTKHEEET